MQCSTVFKAEVVEFFIISDFKCSWVCVSIFKNDLIVRI